VGKRSNRAGLLELRSERNDFNLRGLGEEGPDPNGDDAADTSKPHLCECMALFISIMHALSEARARVVTDQSPTAREVTSGERVIGSYGQGYGGTSTLWGG